MVCLIGSSLELGIECDEALLATELDKHAYAELKKRFKNSKPDSQVCRAHVDEFLLRESRRVFCENDNCVGVNVKSDRTLTVSFYLNHIRGKAESTLKPGQSICRDCRTSLAKPPLKRKRKSETSDEDIDATANIESFNTLLESLGIGKLDNAVERKGTFASQLKSKVLGLLDKITSEAKTCGIDLNINVIKGESAIIDLSNLVSQLKDYLPKVGYREKIQALTLVPKSWSLSDTTKYFNDSGQVKITRYMVQKSRDIASGILGLPKKKNGCKITEPVLHNIKEFFYDDNISRCLPGVAQTKIVKGEVRAVRLLLSTVGEAYIAFKQKNPEAKVGKSKFFEIRKDKFPEIKLVGSSGMHNVCVCQKHGNVKFVVDVMGQPKDYFKDLMKIVVCSTTEEKCMLGQCSECNKRKRETALRSTIQDVIKDGKIEFPVHYSKWVKTDSTTIITEEKDLEGYVDLVVSSIYGLLAHHQTTRTQNSCFNSRKKDLELGTAVVQLDFAENYTMDIQNSVPSWHWNNTQATVHPFVMHIRMPDTSIKVVSIAIISDEKKHVTATVYAFQKVICDWMKVQYPHVNSMEYFSDGCGGQYKNFKNFLNLYYHENDFGIKAVWNFFATSHGKGACDGVGGILKRMTTDESMRRLDNNFILCAKDMFIFLKETFIAKKLDIDVIWMPKETVSEIVQNADLESRFALGKTIQGTQKFHKIEPQVDGKIKFSKTSANSQYFVIRKVFKNNAVASDPELTSAVIEEDAIPNTLVFEIGHFYGVAYDNIWYLGKVEDIDEEEELVEISFADPKGSRKDIHYDFKDANDRCWVPYASILYEVNPIQANTTKRTAFKFKLIKEDRENCSKAFDDY